jgi:dipeptide transport system ATP-binding protein
MSKPLLEVENLQVSFHLKNKEVQAVRGVDFTLNKGETLAIVGESGCGKSITAQSMMGLLPDNAVVKEGSSIRLHERELTGLSEKEMMKLRGWEMAMIFQDPMTSLNPVIKVGEQITEGILRHRKISKSEAKKLALDLLIQVGIANPESRLEQYPHQFSGGMRQRIMIAMALACNPSILIADEPTTALDVTIQAQILELFKKLQHELGLSIIIITHDLGVVAQMADKIMVMYAGQVAESGSSEELFFNTQHPYTKGLLRSVPKMDEKQEKLIPVHGTPPDLSDPPSGCPFYLRCPYAMKVCKHYAPPATTLDKEHQVRCWLQDERAKNVSFKTDFVNH